ncbi:MAG TPA: hypothetical protein VFS10_23000 [Pyrinomonadaceae bacterium]|nr:hypothetical protein [Pyrinomonadaceae bacterium]
MNTNSTEGDFGRLIRSLIDGSGSIREVMECDGFHDFLRRIVHQFCFRVFRCVKGPEDLCQEVILSLWEKKTQSKLQIPDNILTEDDFLGWLYVVTRNQYYEMVRWQLAAKRDRSRSDVPFEEIDCPALVADQSGGELLSGFLEFIKRYPVQRQYVIRLWLKDRPYRDIQRIVKRLGFTISHVTVGNWIKASVEEFKKSLDELPKWQRKPDDRRTGS